MPRFGQILDRKMSRKEFIATIGLVLFSLFGLSSIMGIFSGEHKKHVPGSSQTFGIGVYGGQKDA
jgi:hypothetical protein